MSDLEHAVTARLADAGIAVVTEDGAAWGAPTGPPDPEAVGAGAAQVARALWGLFHPGAGRAVPTDVRRLGDVASVPDRVAHALAALPRLPAGVQHGDLRPETMVLDDDLRPVAVHGLRQVHHTADVADLARTLTVVLERVEPVVAQEIWPVLGAMLRGFQRIRPLLPAETDVLGELVLGHALLARADQLAALLAALSPDALRHRIRRLAGLGAPGLPGAAAPAVADLLVRRRAVQGGSLSPLFYDEPLEIVAGEGVWLIDASGRRYLDGYNNVAVVGHSHPRVVQAITRQAGLLHTHSRYLHANVVELAERLVASMPPGSGLDTCLFTTSGTEANELAWRLALEFTGGDAAICGSHAYHGASRQMADLSSNEWPPGYRPTGVATFDGPVQDDAVLTHTEALARVAAAAEELSAGGRRPAMVIADSMFTSEGVRVPPAPFLAGLVDGAHAAGALYVADEVQVGFGRTGLRLWWFAEQGITPDVVTMGKPMGAGYPIAAVVTRREVADALAARYEFFSTFAANPVGTAAALAVLDVLEDDAVPASAVTVGEELRALVRGLAGRYPALGAVRGHGLIAGIDLPDREGATTVKEGLKARGVLVGTTGRAGDVLKVRPPLVWDHTHVARFVAALEETLAAVVG
jgi:4-aminobutyrate aminotransferase-like enzyme